LRKGAKRRSNPEINPYALRGEHGLLRWRSQ
jgi:hypothetical protein